MRRSFLKRPSWKTDPLVRLLLKHTKSRSGERYAWKFDLTNSPWGGKNLARVRFINLWPGCLTAREAYRMRSSLTDHAECADLVGVDHGRSDTLFAALALRYIRLWRTLKGSGVDTTFCLAR